VRLWHFDRLAVRSWPLQTKLVEQASLVTAVRGPSLPITLGRAWAAALLATPLAWLPESHSLSAALRRHCSIHQKCIVEHVFRTTKRAWNSAWLESGSVCFVRLAPGSASPVRRAHSSTKSSLSSLRVLQAWLRRPCR
jgi:hypothetical protein